MPRSRSRPAPSVSRAPARPTTSQPSRSSSTAPTQTSQPYGSVQQPQQSSGGGMLSGFMGNVVQGMAFGTGSAIAHRAVGSVAGAMSGGEQQPAPPQEVQQQQAPVQSVNNCAIDQQNFIQCLNANQGSVDACQFYFDSLNACQKGQSGFA